MIPVYSWTRGYYPMHTSNEDLFDGYSITNLAYMYHYYITKRNKKLPRRVQFSGLFSLLGIGEVVTENKRTLLIGYQDGNYPSEPRTEDVIDDVSLF